MTCPGTPPAPDGASGVVTESKPGRCSLVTLERVNAEGALQVPLSTALHGPDEDDQ